MINVEKGILTSIVLLILLYNLSLFLSKVARREEGPAQMCSNIIYPFGSLKLALVACSKCGPIYLDTSYQK